MTQQTKNQDYGGAQEDGFLWGSVGKESTWNEGDLSLIPGLGRSPGEGKGYPLQCSGMENSKNWTRPSDFHFHFQEDEEALFWEFDVVTSSFLHSFFTSLCWSDCKPGFSDEGEDQVSVEIKVIKVERFRGGPGRGAAGSSHFSWTVVFSRLPWWIRCFTSRGPACDFSCIASSVAETE